MAKQQLHHIRDRGVYEEDSSDNENNEESAVKKVKLFYPLFMMNLIFGFVKRRMEGRLKVAGVNIAYNRSQTRTRLI